MEDSGKQIIYHNVDILCTGEYADFTIGCSFAEFKVHKNIICPQSDFFKKLCSGRFKEANASEARLDHEDPEILARIILFLYTGEYLVTEDLTSSLLTTKQRVQKLKTLSVKLALSDHVYKGTKHPYGTSLLIARLYTAADQYLIPHLKKRAEKQLDSSLMSKSVAVTGRVSPAASISLLGVTPANPEDAEEWAKDFLTAVKYMYEHLPDGDSSLLDIAIRHAKTNHFLLHNETLFIELCAAYPRFAWLLRARQI